MGKRILTLSACVLLVLAASGAYANLFSGSSFGDAITSPAETVSLDSSGSSDGIGTVSIVPIPGAVWLLGSGLVVLLGLRRKRRR